MKKVQYFCSATPETSINNIGLADVCNCKYNDLLFGFRVLIAVTVKSSIFGDISKKVELFDS
jgi:hypothetical protein